jgi:VIT1/CCC1 family predicted Fe2+/Mn2+ transporter
VNTRMSHKHELHFSQRSGWLRAAVLGANDGIVTTASLILGVAAANADRSDIMLTGLATIVAGALSMAVGEYVSVSSQADSEAADLRRETRELAEHPELEYQELVGIYMKRGLDETLARAVATQLTHHDALGAHARDELGLSELHAANPMQAALASATSFAVGAVLPLLLTIVSPESALTLMVGGGSLVLLAALGALAANAGGATLLRGAVRVTLGGAIAMAATMAIGAMFGSAV